ncbi:MAG: sugar ABC transporter permease [Lachnospiraceae bacterium]|nr:sugar ABC transporter permease [Lachnospiraceae bacterium]
MENTHSYSMKKKIVNVFVHLFLAVLGVIWVFPIFWVIMTSFRAGKGSYSTTFIPKEFTIDNYVKLFQERSVFDFPRMFGNTFVVAVFSCILSLFFLISIAYVMSRMRFKMRKPFLNIALVLGMFPGFMSMIAVYYILKGVGLIDGGLKLLALVLVYSGGANLLSFYVAKGFFDTIPKGIDEAAYMEGATRWDVLTKIIMPLSKPILVYTMLQSFIAPWTDFIFAKVIIGSEAKYYTVAVGLWNMLNKENIYNWYTRFAAGAVCISIPIAILFIYVQRYYADGLSGAVKG